MENEIYSSKIFIGREKEIEIFEKFLDDPKREKNILNIYGKGGLGKTQLLLRYINLLEKRKQEGEDILFLTEPIDLYWTAHQSSIGVLKTIALQLSKEIFQPFFEEVEAYSKLLESQSVGLTSEKHQELEKKIIFEFIDNFKKLKTEKIVLFFDTAELTTDSIQHFWQNLLPELDHEKKRLLNVVAGREKVKFNSDKKVNYFSIIGFKIEEVKKYFHEQGFTLDTKVLKKVTDLSDGHPILIALTIDWIKDGNTANDLVNFDNKENFKENLVSRVQHLNFPEDQAILSMAHLYRRYDRDVFSYIWERSEEETKKIMENLARFSFVKYRPPVEDYPGSCTLHDEMRDMINQIVWPRMDPSGEYRQKWNIKIIQYYLRKIHDETEHIERRNFILEKLYYSFNIDIEKTFEEASQLFENARDRFDIDLMEGIINETEKQRNRLTAQMVHRLQLNKGVVLRRREKNHEVIKILSKLLEEENVDHKIRAEATIRLTSLYTDTGEPQKAIDIGLPLEKRLSFQLENMQSKEGDFPVIKRQMGELCNNIGFAFRNLNYLNETVEYYKKALLHYSEINEVYGPRARTQNNLGYVYHCLGKNREAMAHCEIALKLRQKLDIPYELGLSYNVLGIIYADLLRTNEAVNYFKEALNAFERAQSRRGKALVYIAYSRLLRQTYWEREKFANEPFEEHLEEYEKAAKMLQDAIDILRSLPNYPVLIEALNEYGSLLRHQKDWEKAIDAIKESLDLSINLNNTFRKIDNLQDLGYIYYLEEDYDNALKFASQAREEAEKEKSYNLFAKAQMTVCRVKFIQKRYDEAFRAGVKACIYLLLPDPSGFLFLSPKEERIFDYFENEITEFILRIPNEEEAKKQCDYLIEQWQIFSLDGHRVREKYESFIDKFTAIKRDYKILKGV